MLPIAHIATGAALTACAPEPGAEAPFAPDYGGVETRLLDGDLVEFRVSMTGARRLGTAAGDEIEQLQIDTTLLHPPDELLRREQ